MPKKTSKCIVCKKEANPVVELLMSGPDGFRRYKLCQKCADKQKAKSNNG